MTRQQYIDLLNEGNKLQIVYNFYVDECVRRNLTYLQPEEFVNTFTFWGKKGYYTTKIIEFYNQMFDPRRLEYKEQLIKFI